MQHPQEQREARGGVRVVLRGVRDRGEQTLRGALAGLAVEHDPAGEVLARLEGGAGVERGELLEDWWLQSSYVSK